MSSSVRQKEIVDAALNLVFERGIQQLTMKRIAESVGVSEPAIYRHFLSKSEVLAAIVAEIENFRSCAATEARAGQSSADLALHSFFGAQAAMFARRPAMTAVLFAEDVFRDDRGLLERVIAKMRETQSQVLAEVERGIREGLFREGLDPGNSAVMLLGGFRHLVAQWRLENRSFDLAAATEAYIGFALGLLAAEARGTES